MNNVKYALAVLMTGVVCAGMAQEEECARSFGKWRLAVGGAFNGAVKASLGARNVPMPQPYVVPVAKGQEKAERDAYARRFGDGYIGYDSETGKGGWNRTENWKLPTDSYNPETGYFTLENEFEAVELENVSFAQANRNDSDDPYAFGASVEVSRELWVNDEWGENRWGVDFAAGFSYFFRRDLYTARGTRTRSDTVRSGKYQTLVEARDEMYCYIEETDPDYKDYAVDNMYGHGNVTADGISPALDLDKIFGPSLILGQSRQETSSTSYSASGDYRELEMLFMFRPWYEITDWWRVFAQVGIGVSWGRFESDFSSVGIHRSETFDKWDCYGVAGLGTMFRYGMFNLSLDFLGRFLRDDFDVNGQYVHGTISRANWGFRVMAGVEF